MRVHNFIMPAVCLALALSAAAKDELGIRIGSHALMQTKDFGLTTDQRSWDATARVVTLGKRKIVEDYTMITGKRSHCHNEGTETTYGLVNANGDTLRIELRHYTDGYAFRYIVPRVRQGEKLTAEATAYHLPAKAPRWMQIYDGPGYEHFFPLNRDGVSPEKAQVSEWGYPALAEVAKGTFVLLTEADLLRGHCGSILRNAGDDRNCYGLRLFGQSLPLKANRADGGWQSAWRVVISGTLATVVESTLVTDVATPCQLKDTQWIEPGLSSWIYWAHNHGSQEYSILKEYVDLAVEMKWPYTLVDAEWDIMRGGTIEQLVRYACDKGIKPMIWYNSTTNWTGKWAPTPQGRLNDAADRDREFSTIAGWGVKGVKIDFFREDDLATMDYYLDLLECAERHHLLVNFHGGTIPRGWQRTFPHFISAESVYGAEWYNNNGTMTSKAACHNATLPYTRNVIGPMDYTPGTFTDSQHPHITTHAHELALPILFESGIQHMPDRPSTYLQMLPKQVRELLSVLPSAWDETRLLAGYPGESVVIARRKGTTWYIAGINGTDKEKTLSISLKDLHIKTKPALLVTDGQTQTAFVIDYPLIGNSRSIKCAPRGGFVMVL